MPEFKVRKRHLVVRRHAPWRRRLAGGLAVAAVVVVAYGIYEWGRFDGGYDRFEAIQRQRELGNRVAQLEDENRSLRAQVAANDVSHEVEKRAYADVERTLGELQAQVLRQNEELTFYRGIVSPEDGLTGLKIQRFDIEPATGDGKYRLRLVLVQSLRPDRIVSGAVQFEFEGTRSGAPTHLALRDTQSNVKGDGRLPFSFRYFENLEQEVTLPGDFVPMAVTVRVRAARQEPIEQSFPWQVRTTG
jgi:Family of unknown function (DUF6776)